MKKLSLIVAMCGLCAFGYAQTNDFISPLASNVETSIVTMSDIPEDSDVVANDPIGLSPSSSCLFDQVVSGYKTISFSGPQYIIINMIGAYGSGSISVTMSATNQNGYWTGAVNGTSGHYEIWNGTLNNSGYVNWEINVLAGGSLRLHIDSFYPSW